MAVDSSFTKSNDIVDSPGSQTAKQAILWNESNLDDLITAFNAHTHNATTDTLTNKTIDADNNTISNIEHGAECDEPSSGVHGVTGSIVGTTDTQTLTNKTIDADNSTISNLEHGAEVDEPASGVHGVTGTLVGTSDTQTLTNKTIAAASNTVTISVSDLSDGITATGAEINTACDGITATAAELNSAADGIGVTIPRTKVVEIGDWNMDTTTSKAIAHGLNLTQIVAVRAMVRNDADDARYMAQGYDQVTGTDTHLAVMATGAGNVNLQRYATGFFDSTDFNATSYNRGWVVIDYID